MRFPTNTQDNNSTNNNISSINSQKEFRKIISGNRSNIKNYETKVINSEEKFQELLNLHDTNIISNIYIPKIDFNLKSVIGIFLGDRPSSGYSVDIEKIVEEKNELKIYIKEIIPEKGDTVKAEITQPFLIIETIKSNKKIAFINNNIPIQENEISYSIIDSGNDSGIKTLSRRFAKSDQEFSNLYTEHISGQKNIVDNTFPKIDFNKYMLAGIFLGKRDNNAYSIRIDKVIKTNSQIIIKASEIFVRNSDFQEKDFYPYIFLQIEQTNLPVNFEINFIFSEITNNEISNTNKILNSNVFLSGDNSNYKEPDYILIKDNQSFQKVWNTHIGNRFESMPIIDFSRNDVISVFLGNKERSGYIIKINNVIETENDLKIFVEVTFDEQRIRNISSSPYSMFLIPKTNKSVSFIVKDP